MRRNLVNSESNIAGSTYNRDMDWMPMPLRTAFYVIPSKPDHAACWTLKETAFLSVCD
jgi:hypothetical protein